MAVELKPGRSITCLDDVPIDLWHWRGTDKKPRAAFNVNEFRPNSFVVDYSSPDLHMRLSICDANIHWLNLLSAGLEKTNDFEIYRFVYIDLS